MPDTWEMLHRHLWEEGLDGRREWALCLPSAEETLLRCQDLASSLRLLRADCLSTGTELLRRIQERLLAILQHSTQVGPCSVLPGGRRKGVLGGLGQSAVSLKLLGFLTKELVSPDQGFGSGAHQNQSALSQITPLHVGISAVPGVRDLQESCQPWYTEPKL